MSFRQCHAPTVTLKSVGRDLFCSLSTLYQAGNVPNLFNLNRTIESDEVIDGSVRNAISAKGLSTVGMKWSGDTGRSSRQDPVTGRHMSSTARIKIHVLKMKNEDVMQQLVLEEALFRKTKENWLIVNDGVKHPAVVLGISGKPEEMVHEDALKNKSVVMIKRFTGGGTVVVDQDTVMMSLIMNGKQHLPNVPCFPRPVMQWCADFLQDHMRQYGEFRLQETDFVIGEKKIGGNAQAISGGRWLHHTSFLYDYNEERMSLLKHPPKCPEYRKGRNHVDFITRLRHFESNRARFVDGIETSIESNGFIPIPTSLDAVQEAVQANTLVGTKVLYSPAGIYNI